MKHNELSKSDPVMAPDYKFDVGIVGGTPSGISAAISAAEMGCSVVILLRESHLGGLLVNGLGATDIETRGATTGLFTKFVDAINNYYLETYGPDSEAFKMCSNGYHFEPLVAEKIIEEMLSSVEDKVTIRRNCTFNHCSNNVSKSLDVLKAVRVQNDNKKCEEWYKAKVWIDATYEGDLAAAAGVSYRLGRENKEDFDEPMAGHIFKGWGTPADVGSTGDGDHRIQSYNFRLCLSNEEKKRVPFSKPDHYDRLEYVSLIEDFVLKRRTGRVTSEFDPDGIGFITNIIHLPNKKTDANNQHLAFLSTDLPEENQGWPEENWQWRDAFARRLREYTQGLFYFAANDSEVPGDLRRAVSSWGWAADEYLDNENFPRQVYVREGRRIKGNYSFTAHDALPVENDVRPPVHIDSITSSHYALDSHACRKREPNRPHLEGFFSLQTSPYTVPIGVMLPNEVKGLLVPVAASATHVGLSTLRMEPCWMAMGEAAGVTAALAVGMNEDVSSVSVSEVQKKLLDRDTTLIYFKNDNPSKEGFKERQLMALQDPQLYSGWMFPSHVLR